MVKIAQLIPVVMSSDVERSIVFYHKLGFHVFFKDFEVAPRYVGIRRDGIELHIQWNDLSGLPIDVDRPVYRFGVDDVDGLAEEFTKSGVPNIKGPWETAWGTYEFHVQDHDRNGFQFYRSGNQ
jgi:predicted enzyme related to lactoylglutathione lyase